MPWENIQQISEVQLEPMDEKKNDWKIQIIAKGETITGNRYYPAGTLKRAVDEGLYDGAKIYINHEFEEKMHRDMHDYAGNILDGSVEWNPESETVSAIAHFHKTEALEMLTDDVARKNVGLSQSIYAKSYPGVINGESKDIIEQIKSVGSVDIVPTGNAYGYFLENKSEDQNMDITKLTLDELKVERPDLVQTIEESVEQTFDENSEEIKTLVETEVQKRLDAINAEIEQAAKQLKAEEMVKDSELPEAAKQRVLENLADYDEEKVSEAIQKEIEYIESLKPAEEIEEEIEVGIGQSESVVEDENKYEETFVEYLKKSGLSAEMIKKLSAK